MVGRPPPRPSPANCAGEGERQKLVVAGPNSPLSARNERGGVGGGAPRGRSSMLVGARHLSPEVGGEAGRGGLSRTQLYAFRRAHFAGSHDCNGPRCACDVTGTG